MEGVESTALFRSDSVEKAALLLMAANRLVAVLANIDDLVEIILEVIYCWSISYRLLVSTVFVVGVVAVVAVVVVVVVAAAALVWCMYLYRLLVGFRFASFWFVGVVVMCLLFLIYDNSALIGFD